VIVTLAGGGAGPDYVTAMNAAPLFQLYRAVQAGLKMPIFTVYEPVAEVVGTLQVDVKVRVWPAEND
jgi:hypothetical protein